jgi:nicotinamidase-related amidase
VVKPKHSGFFSTALELLLQHLRAHTVILTGLTADNCVLVTASDAYLRGYHLVVPGRLRGRHRPPPHPTGARAHASRAQGRGGGVDGAIPGEPSRMTDASLSRE